MGAPTCREGGLWEAIESSARVIILCELKWEGVTAAPEHGTFGQMKREDPTSQKALTNK
jgi:hypothetical protein